VGREPREGLLDRLLQIKRMWGPTLAAVCAALDKRDGDGAGRRFLDSIRLATHLISPKLQREIDAIPERDLEEVLPF
jgi:hypothetical protein